MNHNVHTAKVFCAFIAAVALVVMGLVVAEKHYAHQALVNQESSVKW